jgi:hypothetical protein
MVGRNYKHIVPDICNSNNCEFLPRATNKMMVICICILNYLFRRFVSLAATYQLLGDLQKKTQAIPCRKPGLLYSEHNS